MYACSYVCTNLLLQLNTRLHSIYIRSVLSLIHICTNFLLSYGNYCIKKRRICRKHKCITYFWHHAYHYNSIVFDVSTFYSVRFVYTVIIPAFPEHQSFLWIWVFMFLLKWTYVICSSHDLIYNTERPCKLSIKRIRAVSLSRYMKNHTGKKFIIDKCQIKPQHKPWQETIHDLWWKKRNSTFQASFLIT